MGGKHRPGNPRDRALGAELRSIREQAGKSLEQVAREIQWNMSTLSRLERGLRHISSEAVMGLSMVYQLPAERRDELVTRAKEPVALGWWDRPPAGVPGDLGALASYENEAVGMIDWSPALIPGLLQTSDYARAVIRDSGASEQDVEPRLRARLQRQTLLDRRNVDYTALIGIGALNNQLCGEDQFTAQLRRLRQLANRDGITIQLVEAPTALTFGSWYLRFFENAGPVIVIEHLGSSTFLFDEEARPYLDARARLDEIALSVRATNDKIEELIERYIVGS